MVSFISFKWFLDARLPILVHLADVFVANSIPQDVATDAP